MGEGGYYFKYKDSNTKLQEAWKMPLPKDHSNFPATNPKDIEIYELTNTEFKIAVSGKLNELQEKKKNNSTL